VKALADYSDSSVANLMLQRWRQFTPDVRTEVLQALLSRENRTLALLQAADKGEVSLAATDAARRELLLRHRNEEVRKMAEKIFGKTTHGDRAAVVESYRPTLRLDGDPKRGAPVFEKHCSICHAL